MHKHILLAVVYNRFLFHASIAFKVATDNHTGGYAARIGLSMNDDIRLHVARSYTSSADSPFSLTVYISHT